MVWAQTFLSPVYREVTMWDDLPFLLEVRQGVRWLPERQRPNKAAVLIEDLVDPGSRWEPGRLP